MARIDWPADHPNTKILMFVDSSRQVLARATPGADSAQAGPLLDEIEALIDQMRPGTTAKAIQSLANRVMSTMGVVMPVMERVTAAVAAQPREVSAANARAAAAAAEEKGRR